MWIFARRWSIFYYILNYFFVCMKLIYTMEAIWWRNKCFVVRLTCNFWPIVNFGRVIGFFFSMCDGTTRKCTTHRIIFWTLFLWLADFAVVWLSIDARTLCPLEFMYSFYLIWFYFAFCINTMLLCLHLRAMFYNRPYAFIHVVICSSFLSSKIRFVFIFSFFLSIFMFCWRAIVVFVGSVLRSNNYTAILSLFSAIKQFMLSIVFLVCQKWR